MAQLNLTEDVVDIVVHELKDDRKSLLACSVIARAWSAPSQKQLVTCARVNGVRVAERLRYTLREALWLAPHIQQLHVHSDAVSGLVDIHNVLGTPLPRLRRLHLTHNLQGGVFGGDMPLPHFQTIQHLQLGAWRFADLWHMQRFFTQFRSLTSLRVGHGLFQITQSVMDMPAPALNLSDLKIDDIRPVDAMRLCSWLGAGRPIIPPGITVLHMPWSLLSSVNISECASGLHELCLSYSCLYKIPPALPRLTLLACLILPSPINASLLRSPLEDILAAFCNSAPLLSQIRFSAAILRLDRTGHSNICWNGILAFMVRVHTATWPLKSLLVTLSSIKEETETFAEALNLAEREAKSYTHYGQAISGLVTLTVHAEVLDSHGVHSRGERQLRG